MLATAKRWTDAARPGPRRGAMSDQDNARLVRRLEALVERWESGEGDRRARDRRGIRMFREQAWQESLVESKLAITSNTPLALFERVAADVLRGQPEPEIEAVNPDEEDNARVAEGALRTNWRKRRVREKLAAAYRLTGFTRPVGFYHYWRHEADGGRGDVDKRMIPGHRLIVDDRVQLVHDMEFVGFEEEMSRAKLITLFPDKAEQIEKAGDAAATRPPNITADPLAPRAQGQTPTRVVDRLVAQGAANTPPYTPATSIKSPQQRGKGDPLSENVRVRFLWVDDPTPTREQRPMLDPRTKKPMYKMVRDEEGKPQLEHRGHDVVDTPLGPQYVPNVQPRFEMAMEDVVVRKYRYWRHVAYVPEDRIVLWDVAWDGPAPISILRDRVPAYGFDAPGSALRLATLATARNILWTIIFERLKLSLGGTWLATPGSGIKRNKLIPEPGVVFMVNKLDEIKEFPVTPLDAAYFNLLDKIEQEMELLVGVTPLMRGQPVGRADSPQTYEQVADQSGGPVLDRAKLVDAWVHDAAEIDLWFMQHYYTHEHVVEVETADGFTTWTEASALAIRGDFAVRIEAGSTLGRNVMRDREEAKENANLGFYSLPMLGRVGRVRHWRQALKQKAAIMRMGPQSAWLLGAAGAPPATQSTNIRAGQQRSHHRPGGK